MNTEPVRDKCPFCGSLHNKITRLLYPDRSCVVCLNCLARGPESASSHIAVEKWNSASKEQKQ